MHFQFTEPPQGYETLWFLGDESLTKASGHLSNDELEDLYIKCNYNIKFQVDNNLSLNRSVLGHICNTMINAVNNNLLLPKAIIVILDDDLIKPIKSHLSYVFGAMVHWLIGEFDKIVKIHKDNLPLKSRKVSYPVFIWIAPPQNAFFKNNEIRQKIDKVLKRTTEMGKNHIMLRMKKLWNYHEHGYVDESGVRFTSKGYQAMWKSIDSVIQFWDRHLAPNSMGFSHLNSGSNITVVEDPMKRIFTPHYKHYGGKNRSFHKNSGHQGDHQFHQRKCNQWDQRDAYHWEPEQLHCKMPKPPPHIIN